MKKVALFVALCIGLYTGLSAKASTVGGDVERGQELAGVCAACHGPNGNSPSDMYPKIAGQHAPYLLKQLLDYQRAAATNGEEGRANAIMQGQVSAYNEQELADLAAYFAAQDPEVGSTTETAVAYAQPLYRGGDDERNIPACTACHGPRGDGMGLAKFPDISGQHASYARQQLEMFRSGERANDPNGMMRDVAAKLTDKDIEMLSSYLEGLY
ncbi:c-type cytochrome [Pseudidiomarina sp.]|uniref:c-type cytochrome n=1 Tax=Pseudidiomarina sp. TaxID=2081707 RepID=UPI00299D08CF|nr:c-type cytochrome [Pseudidiomarina sp.]MDX1706590.1 c-type cytochrome [Pseudidiomarina sp.]